MLPVFGATNLAPLDPLVRLRENRSTENYLCDALKERFKNHLKRYEAERREILSSSQELSLMIQGNHFLTFNPYENTWRAMKPKTLNQDTMRGLNLLQYFVTNWIEKWRQSKPDVIIKSAFDDDTAITASLAADALYDRYERQFFKAFQMQQQGLHCLTFGNYLVRVRHNKDAQANILYREIFEDKEIALDDGYGRCSCGFEATAQEFSQVEPQTQQLIEACPKCGSPNVYVTPPVKDVVPVRTGTEPVKFGDIELEPLTFSGAYWDFKTQAHESEWFIYRQNVPKGKILALLGDVEIPGEPDMNDFGLKIAETLAHSGSAVGGSGSHGRRITNDANAGEVTVDEMWLQVDDYRDIRLKADEKTVGGQVIPKGTRLSDVFPEKLCVVGMNGMELISGLYDESVKDYLAAGVCHIKSGSGVGRNGSDMIEPQKRFNKFDSQMRTAFDATGSPGQVYFKGAIEEDHVAALGRPNTAVPIDGARFPGLGLNQIVQPLQAGSVNGQMIQYAQGFLKDVMQFTSHIMDFTNGLPGVNIDTKGGAEIASANAASIFSPVLELKAEVMLRVAKLTLALHRKVMPPAVTGKLLGKNGESRAKAFHGIDLDEALTFEIAKDSEVPRSTFTRRQEYVAFFNAMSALGGFEMAMAKYPYLVQETAQLFNVTLDSINADEVGLRCNARLQQMQEALLSGVIDPTGLVQLVQPPISLAEPAHQQKMQWWSNWLDTDAAWKPENLPLRDAALLMAQAHFQAMGALSMAAGVQSGQVAGQVAQEAEAPPQ